MQMLFYIREGINIFQGTRGFNESPLSIVFRIKKKKKNNNDDGKWSLQVLKELERAAFPFLITI